jgi:hypothetical protein
MIWRNARGDVVDPAPFVVSSLLAIMLIYSFGPVYAMEYGFSLRTGLVICTVLTVTTIAVAYRRLIWQARPEMRAEIPPDVRLQRLFYGVIIGIILLSALTFPIVVGV